MNADPEHDALILGHADVALDHRVLHFDGAAHGFDDAAELDQSPVTSALEDASVLTAIVGSMRSVRNALSRASMRSSSALAIRL